MSLADKTKSINILGVTGSIGQSASAVILAQPERFDVHVVSANNNAEKLAELAIALDANEAVLANGENFQTLHDLLDGTGIKCSCGEDALNNAAAQSVDVTLAAIVGMAGLPSLMHAIENSQAVAIANKEPLVAAGELVMAHAKTHGTKILPVDSEHNAIFQVFDFDRIDEIERIILTASGGPFREYTTDQMANVSPAQAIQHPNWSMGAKISVDSATMMNKALEVIEAHYLFGVPVNDIEVVVHPQSTVHSMVEYKDGSVLAQMGASDMCTPIANVLAWPDRLATPGARLDLKTLSRLDFEAVDDGRFPSILLAYRALRMGGHACLAMNAANEIAVQAFLGEQIEFLDIVSTVEYILDSAPQKRLSSLEQILSYDDTIRQMTIQYLETNITNQKRA